MYAAALRLASVCALAATVFAGAAEAQKAKDTVRVPFNEPIDRISPYFTSHPGASFFVDALYEPLVYLNPRTAQFEPLLAKAWKRIDPTTLEFDLRDDITFHSGNKLTADDVVYMINWIIDPNANLRHNEDTDWIKSVEKLGPYKVRIHANEPVAVDLSMLSYSVRIYDSQVMKKVGDVGEYEREHMIGTGPYKITQRDVNKGVIIVKNEDYKHAPSRVGQIGKLIGLVVPDEQSRIANLLTGNVDVVADLPQDQIAELSANPNLTTTNSPSLQYIFLQLDVIGKSGRKELTDRRVRKAIFMGIDRDAIIKHLVAGAELAVPPTAFCIKGQIGCVHTKSLPPYDPEGAKKLLAEAGYPDGFELIVDSTPPKVKALGEVVAGQLSKIGIKARHQPLPTPVYRQWQRDGKLEAHIAPWTNQFDVGRTVNRYFSPGQTNMFGDEVLDAWRIQASKETDPAKRDAIYTQFYDRVNELSYVLPITTVPFVYVHSKDLRIRPGAMTQWGADASDFYWAK